MWQIFGGRRRRGWDVAGSNLHQTPSFSLYSRGNMVTSSLFKYYKMRGPHLFIKWEDMNLCDCTVGEGEKWRWR